MGDPPVKRPSVPTMVGRAVRRRCPWCAGRGAFFTSWFSKQSRCATCGLSWRRGDVGFELGAAAMAAMIVLGPLILGLGAVLAITWPEIEVVPLTVLFLVAGLILPVVLYPLSYTLWQCVDLVMRPVEVDHFDVDHLDMPDDGSDGDSDGDASAGGATSGGGPGSS